MAIVLARMDTRSPQEQREAMLRAVRGAKVEQADEVLPARYFAVTSGFACRNYYGNDAKNQDNRQ